MSFQPVPSRSLTRSLFTLSSREASAQVAACNFSQKQGINNNGEEDLKLACYLMHVTVRTVYSDGQIPQSCFKKIPRLINGIPLGAGKLTKVESQNVQWKFVEGTTSFLSVPILKDEAEESRKRLGGD